MFVAVKYYVWRKISDFHDRAPRSGQRCPLIPRPLLPINLSMQRNSTSRPPQQHFRGVAKSLSPIPGGARWSYCRKNASCCLLRSRHSTYDGYHDWWCIYMWMATCYFLSPWMLRGHETCAVAKRDIRLFMHRYSSWLEYRVPATTSIHSTTPEKPLWLHHVKCNCIQ